MNKERLWWVGIAAALLVCLGIGVLLAVTVAPTPIVGVIRFDQVIDTQSALALADILDQARDDPAVAAVVLEIASPGGSATSSESLYFNLLDLRRTKPLVALVDGVAASGGYYMAVAANRIYATASSYVGNVGTRGGRPTDPAIYPEELSSGPYKLTGGSRFDQIRQLELVAQTFISNVVTMRSNAVLNPLRIDAETVGEARIYLGSEALAIGMIDAQGGPADAVRGAAELAGINNYRTVDLLDYYKRAPATAPAPEPLAEQVGRLVRNAAPDTIYMVDDRVPLPAPATNNRVLEHLRELRAAAAGPLHLRPAAALSGAWPEHALIPREDTP